MNMNIFNSPESAVSKVTKVSREGARRPFGTFDAGIAGGNNL